MRTLTLTAVLAAVTLASGCGGSDGIDTGKAESFIRGAVEEQVGADVKSVSCPADQKQQKGARFTCVVTGADGTKGNAIVTQKDDDGNVRVSAPFIHKDEVEQNVGAQFTAGSKVKVTLSCPDIILPKAGGTFVCQAVDSEGDKGLVDVTQTDAKGNFRAVIRKR